MLGRFYAVYLEPIISSGERFNIAVVAECESAKSVTQTLSEAKISCLFSNRAPEFAALVNSIIKSLQEHVYDKGLFDQWQAPFNGITTSRTYKWKGRDIEQLERQAISSTASLFDESEVA